MANICIVIGIRNCSIWKSKCILCWSQYNVLCIFYSNASDLKKEDPVDLEKLLDKERKIWNRSCPAELYYQPGDA